MSRRLDVPSFESIWSGLDHEAMRQVESDATDLQHRMPWYFKVMVVLGLVLFFPSVLVMFIPTVLLGIALMAVPAYVTMRRAGEVSRSATQNVSVPVFQSIAEGLSTPDAAEDGARLNAVYEPEGRVSVPRLRSSGFIMDPSVHQEDVVTGTLGETDFVLADLKWEEMTPPAPSPEESDEERRSRERRLRSLERQEDHGTLSHLQERELSSLRARDSRGGDLGSLMPAGMKDSARDWLRDLEKDVATTRSSFVYFSADFHKEFTSTTFLLPTQQHQAFRSMSEEAAETMGLSPLRLEDVRVSQRFDAWTSDQVEARYLITPEFMDTLQQLHERFDTEHIAVSFTHGQMHIGAALDRNRFGLDVVRQQDLGVEDVARQVYDDFLLFLGLVEDFRLNTRIWSKR